MPAEITEFFNGGIVTARHGALLSPGELQRADDCVYRDKDTAIWRAPGRAARNATVLGSPSAIKGLFHAAYERARTDQLLAVVDTALYRSDVTAGTLGTIDALSFSEISGPGIVAGAVTSSTTFTATTGFPFTADVVGTRIYGANVTAGTYVTAVSGQSGTTGHYNIVTLSLTSTATSITFEWGVVQALTNSGLETLDAAQYDAAYFAWDGSDELQRLSWRGRPTIAGTGLADILMMRPAGLEPVREPFTLAEVSDATYAWNTVLGVGVYWFLITEAFAPGGNMTAAEKDSLLKTEIIESAWLGPNTKGDLGLPLPITLSAVTGKGIQITFPAVVNTGIEGRISNVWNVYIYGPTTDASTAPSLAAMRRIASVPITQYTAGFTYVIKDVISTAAQIQQLRPTAHATDDGATEMTNGANATGTPDKNYAVASSGGASSGQNLGVVKLSTWVDYNTGAAVSTTGIYASAIIVGIRVNVFGKALQLNDATDRAGYYLHLDTAAKHSPRFSKFFGGYGDDTTGGPTDTLGVAWVVGDLSTLSVTIGKTGTGAKQRLGLDAVRLDVFFTGSSLNLNGPAYRVVTYRDQIGLSVSEPVNLPPPRATTGCFFQGSLVLNDLNDETAIRYSLPGSPEAFPKPYVMRFNATARRDKVKYLTTLNQYLLVGLENSIERVGYLPRETDTDLESGLSHEPITADHGIPGPFCAVKFDMPGEGTLLAYASLAGPFLTNGLAPRPLSNALDWAGLIKTSALSTAVFKCYPKEKWLVLYYCPAGATHTKNTRAIIFHYQADKIKADGTLAVTGPIVVSARSVATVIVNGSSYVLTGHESNGKVYQEDFGTSVPSGYQVRLNDDSANGDGKTASATDVTIVPLIRTRKIYAAGILRDMREEKIGLLFTPYGTSSAVTCSTTINSATVTSAAAFASVIPGMRVTGAGIDPGTIVLAKASSSSITISRNANATGTNVSLSFDTGAVGVTIRASGVGEAVVGCDTQWGSLLTGDLIEFHNDNSRQGIELQIEKVPLTFDANHDTATWADLSTNMRLHQFTLLTSDTGSEMNHSTA